MKQEPLKPSSNISYTLLGFLGIALIFVGIFYFVLKGAWTLKSLAVFDYIVGIISPAVGLMLFFGYMHSKKLHKQVLKKHDEVIVSPKTIDLMTGVSYFFVFIIVTVFLILPTLLLIWAAIK